MTKFITVFSLVSTFSLFIVSDASAEEKKPVVKSTPVIQITADKPEDQDFGYSDNGKKDPIEPVNRGIFVFNDTVDKAVIKPVAKAYKKVVPEWGRERISNFFNNLKAPVTMVNSLLQGDVKNALSSFWGFFVNTTIGVGGLYNEAEAVGLSTRQEDFGQTAGFYGVDSGPFLVLPIIGPTSVRDGVGFALDSVTNPFNYASGDFVVGKSVGQGVSDRADALELTDEIERTSFDPYSTYRSAYFQRRASQISNGNVNTPKMTHGE